MSDIGIDVYIPERGGEGDDNGPFKESSNRNSLRDFAL
jgi:hypothetical protein